MAEFNQKAVLIDLQKAKLLVSQRVSTKLSLLTNVKRSPLSEKEYSQYTSTGRQTCSQATYFLPLLRRSWME
ncbi:hypothetical protein T07_6114 [Trichinella nelsoni]|uniref:Uncharacterized protein n=1 Tax=Trichinella nelsoni TaxID=6336 RepID=A0A0V0RMY6_9BILA|nr:hypothetical protein T07_11564 [Trichinella nelsoni]KRX16127.1 hypothetical protein T07_6114 [Trichinella nelsoni]